MIMFVRIADSDGRMTAAEMQLFDRLIGSRDWCRSPFLQRSLINTEQGKAEQCAIGGNHKAASVYVD
jgi:hypothetical protein